MIPREWVKKDHQWAKGLGWVLYRGHLVAGMWSNHRDWLRSTAWTVASGAQIVQWESGIEEERSERDRCCNLPELRPSAWKGVPQNVKRFWCDEWGLYDISSRMGRVQGQGIRRAIRVGKQQTVDGGGFLDFYIVSKIFFLILNKEIVYPSLTPHPS